MATQDYQRAYQREKQARQAAEKILEDKTRELYLANQSLLNQYNILQRQAAEIELFLALAKFVQEQTTFNNILQFFINSVCKLCQWPLGHIYIPEIHSGELKPSNIWSIANSEQYRHFQEITANTQLQHNVGLPGVVLARGESVWVDDFSKHSEFPRVGLCKNLNLKGAFAIPIKRYNKIVAIAEFFSTETQIKDQHLLDLVNSAASQLGVLLEQRQAETEAKENYQKLLQTQLELKQLAHHDSLTSLPNRLQFENTLKREIARAERYNDSFALFFVDLDYFKTINDSHGHDVGDLLLKEVAIRLQTNIHAGDFVARLGGDEFAIILTHINNKNVVNKIAEHLIDCINRPYRLAKYDIAVGVSIGIAYYPEAGTEAVSLIKNADIAMYSVKSAGRNNYNFFTTHLITAQTQQADYENALRLAIGKNELSLVYQPKYDIKSSKIIGFEALLRWQHSTLGNIVPDIFIPIAENTGLILKISDWVLETACQQYAKWYTEYNLTSTLAINISPQQLKQQNFISNIKQILQKNQLPPQILELEITEVAAIVNIEEAKDTLNKLHDLGVQLSIDDFGTGYSTLSRLKQLPINTIKIDKSFIKDVNNNINDAIIVKAAIALAQGLGLNIVAEGVETREQLEFLLQNECPQAQGFYYNKPLNLVEMDQLIKAINKK